MRKLDFQTSYDYLNYMYSDIQGWITKSSNLTYYTEHFYQASSIMDQKTVENQKSIYISMNTFFKKNRQVTCLKRLNACYVDIDCYKLGIKKETVIYLLDQYYFGKSLPIPTFIIDSGRGIYLIWKLKNEDRNALPRWQKVQEHFIRVCQEFGSDSACSDAARILRIPFSINERNGEQVKILRFYDYAYTLYEIIKEYDIPYAPYKREKRIRTTEKMRRCALKISKEKGIALPNFENYGETFNYIKKNYIKKNSAVTVDPEKEITTNVWITKLFIDRCDDLERLFALRKGQECKREIALFLYRLWQIIITGNFEQALQKTLEFNQKLDCPFSDRYVITRTRSAERIIKRGKFYKYSNDRIIQDLEITDQEKQCLNVFTDRFSNENQKIKRQEKNRKAYVARLKIKGELEKKEKVGLRRKALFSMQKKGMSVKEICKKLNISKTTYYRDVMAINQMNQEKKEEAKTSSCISEMISKGVKKIVKKLFRLIQRANTGKQNDLKSRNMKQMMRVSFFQPLYYKGTPLGVLRGPICHAFVFNTS